MCNLRKLFPRLVPAKGAATFPLFVVALVCALFLPAAPASAKTAMQEYVEAMQPGWNLGNALDATPTETSWGNPLVTQEFIQQIKAQGFKSIRLPVTWSTGNRVGPAPTYTIDPAWMDRVQQVVDWSLDAGLYVMLNMHHDTIAMRDRPADYLARYTAIWEQIAPRFRDHPRELMFESINEPEFNNVDDATDIMLVNELNTICFDIVRGTGGGNATRPIVMPTVVTNASQHYLDGLKALMVQLNDPNLIATIHFYGWWPFSVNIAGGIRFDAAVINDIHTTINGAYDTFVADGIPVVVGEFGLLAFDSNDQAVERGEKLKFFEYFPFYAQSKGVTWQLWDNGYHLLDRTTYQWRDPELYGYIMHSLVGRSSTGATDLVFVKNGATADTVIPLNLNGNAFVSLKNGDTLLTPGVDYTLNGDDLTLKASLLAPYASGEYGEKTVLTANFSAGMPWKLRVRHLAVATLGAATGTKDGGLIIPAAFNGDLVATMEAKYVGVDFPYAGPHDWTSFKQHTHTFRPNYTNNTIEIRKAFFDATSNNPIELTFHFWSGRTANYRLTLQPAGEVGGEAQEWVIYEDGLVGWNNWGSWVTNNPNNTTVVHSGTKAISVDAGAYGGLVLQHNPWEAPVNTSAYRTLVFWIHGGSVGGQTLGVKLVRGDDWSSPGVGIPAPKANTWTKVEIPLSGLGVEGSANITRVMFQNWTDKNAPTYYVDDIKLTTAYASTLVFVNGTPAPVITSATSANGAFGTAFGYTITATNSPDTFGATGLPPGLVIDEATGVISGTPTAAGWYTVTLGATSAVGSGTETLTIKIDPAPVVISLPMGDNPFNAAIYAAYDGAPLSVDVTTSPTDIPVTVTYNGSTTVPTLPGTYHVVVTSSSPNYTGTAEGTLLITVTALVRHAPTINGDLDGSLQLLSGESFAVNGSGAVYGDLLVPGTPSVELHSNPAFGGVVDAEGAIAPSDYGITLNGNSLVRYVMRRVDPIAMSTVTAPAAPTGTRDVTLNNANQSAGDFATVRNLTLNGNVGTVTVPAGNYGTFTANGNSTLVLGVVGASEPAVYELQGLTLNGNASVQVVGPVTLKLAQGTSLNGTMGDAAHPEWLEVLINHGGLTLNGNATFNGNVTAPAGAVTINGSLHGRVSADRLTINGNGLLEDPDAL